jgi:hypothetical protein
MKDLTMKVEAHLATLRARLNRKADETIQALVDICEWQQQQLASLEKIYDSRQGWQNDTHADVVAINEAVLHPTGHCTCAGDGTCEWCLTECVGCGEPRCVCRCENLHRPGEWHPGAPKTYGCYEVVWADSGGVMMMVIHMDHDGNLHNVCPSWVSVGEYDSDTREIVRHRKYGISTD